MAEFGEHSDSLPGFVVATELEIENMLIVFLRASQEVAPDIHRNRLALSRLH